MSLYSADGTINTTVVDGSTFTGLYAADGSINVVLDDTTYKGVYHPCGAFRVNSGTGSSVYDASGAYYSNHFFGSLLGRASSGGGATDIAMSAISLNEANAWAGKQIATFTASPSGSYTYSLDNDDSGKVLISKRGALRFIKNPVAGVAINPTVRATPIGGGPSFSKAFTIPVGTFNIHELTDEEWDLSDLSKLKQESTKITAVAADGDPVGSWVGLKQGWGWQKTGTTNRPIYKTGQFGSNASVRFAGNSASFMDAVDSALINYPAGTKRNMTVLILFKNTLDQTQVPISWANGASTRWFIQNNVSGSAVAAAGSLPADAGNSVAGAFADDTNTTATSASSLYGNTTFGNSMFASVTRGDEVATVVLNGKANLFKDITNTAAATMTAARLGQRVGPNNNFFAGDIGWIGFVPRVLTPYESITAMRQIIAEKGGVGVTIAAEPDEIDMSGLTMVYLSDFDDPSNSVLDYINPDWTRDRIEPLKLIPTQITSKTIDGSPGATSFEQGFMPDPRPTSAFVNNPTLSVANDKLIMTPAVTPAPLSANAAGFPYLGASVITKGLVDLEPGSYFEICVQLPSMSLGNRGTFTAPLWILESAGVWRASELDYSEQFGSGQANVNGNNRNMLAANSHNNYTWPMTAINVDSASNDFQSFPLPHDMTIDQHLIGGRINGNNMEVWIDRKLRGVISLIPHALYGVVVNNAGDGTIPAGNLTVIAKGDAGTTNAKLVFTTSGGVITGLSSLSQGGAKFPSSGITFFRSNGTTPLGYGIDLTPLIGTETKRSNIYNGLYYLLVDYGVGGGSVDGGIVDTGTLSTRPMSIDWIAAYDKVITAPAISGSQDSATTTLLSAWSTDGYTPTAPQISALDNVIKYLKAYNFLREDTEVNSGVALNWDPNTMSAIWDRIGGLYVWYKIPVQLAALRNWKNPGGSVLGINGSPVFSPTYGVQFSSTVGEYLETNHGLGGSVTIDPWDNHQAVYVDTGPTDTTWRPIIGGVSGASGFFASLGNSEVAVNVSNTNYNCYNAPTISHGIKPVTSGHIAWLRNALVSTVVKDGRFWSGGYMSSQTVKPSKAAGSTMKFGTSDAAIQGAGGRYRMGHFGAYLTPRECKIIRDQFDGMWSYF